MIQTFNVFISWSHGEGGGSGEDYEFTIRGAEEEVYYLIHKMNEGYEHYYSNDEGYDRYVYYPCQCVVDVVGLSTNDLDLKARELVK
jgi:hypothetical protein